MRPAVLRGLWLLTLPVLGLAVALVAAPGRSGLFTHLFVVVVVTGALTSLVASLAAELKPPERSGFDRALRRRQRPPARVQQLVRTEREVAIARANAFDLHFRLRKTLREIAAGLLLTRRGISLDAQPERAADLLGPDAWALLRPDRPAPADRLGPGIDAATLDRVLTSLEQL
jgi:hypothetical protein